MAGYLPPGCTQWECDHAQGADDEPPQQWFQCDECCGEGEVGTGRMSHMVTSGTIDPPEEIMKQCEKCRGAGGWTDDVEPDECPVCGQKLPLLHPCFAQDCPIPNSR